MSAFLMVELTMRSVDSLRSSFALIASLTALLMASRSIESVLCVVQFALDLSGFGRRDNRRPIERRNLDRPFEGREQHPRGLNAWAVPGFCSSMTLSENRYPLFRVMLRWRLLP